MQSLQHQSFNLRLLHGFEVKRTEHVLVKHIGRRPKHFNFLDKCVIDDNHRVTGRLDVRLADCQFLHYFFGLFDFEERFDIIKDQVKED